MIDGTVQDCLLFWYPLWYFFVIVIQLDKKINAENEKTVIQTTIVDKVTLPSTVNDLTKSMDNLTETKKVKEMSIIN